MENKKNNYPNEELFLNLSNVFKVFGDPTRLKIMKTLENQPCFVGEIAKQIKEKPVAIIAHTIKGKGVSFMEDQAGWHGKAPNEEQYKQAMAELEQEV